MKFVKCVYHVKFMLGVQLVFYFLTPQSVLSYISHKTYCDGLYIMCTVIKGMHQASWDCASFYEKKKNAYL